MIEEDVAGATAERIRGYVVMAITIGARVVEVQASRRRQQLREAERESNIRAQQVAAQQRIEAAMLRQQFRDVARPDWWDAATPTEMGSVYATARAYADVDPEMGGLARHMADEIHVRYGVDAEQVAREAERRSQTTEAVAYLAEANVVEGLTVPAELRLAVDGWDDTARAAGLAARLDRLLPSEPEARHARMAADAMQGEPAASAATKTASQPRIIKPARVPGKSMER